MSDTHDKIEAILRRYGDIPATTTLKPETRLWQDLDLDSLDRIEIGQKLEEEFNLDIDDLDLDKPEMGTFGGLCAYIEKRLAGG